MIGMTPASVSRWKTSPFHRSGSLFGSSEIATYFRLSITKGAAVAPFILVLGSKKV
jgi:hypothetical protein